MIAVDPFYFGESKFDSKDWLWGLMLATVATVAAIGHMTLFQLTFP